MSNCGKPGMINFKPQLNIDYIFGLFMKYLSLFNVNFVRVGFTRCSRRNRHFIMPLLIIAKLKLNIKSGTFQIELVNTCTLNLDNLNICYCSNTFTFVSDITLDRKAYHLYWLNILDCFNVLFSVIWLVYID